MFQGVMKDDYDHVFFIVSNPTSGFPFGWPHAAAAGLGILGEDPGLSGHLGRIEVNVSGEGFQV